MTLAFEESTVTEKHTSITTFVFTQPDFPRFHNTPWYLQQQRQEERTWRAQQQRTPGHKLRQLGMEEETGESDRMG